jgi:hypothetical protein
MARHVFRINEPVHLTFSAAIVETYAYFDVGIGPMEFSLSVFAKFSGVVSVEILYGDKSLGSLAPMQGVGGIVGEVITEGFYDVNPGPYLTMKVKGIPLEGFTSTDVVCTLRASEAFDYPDSYTSPDYFDLGGPTPKPWMLILTTPWFRDTSPSVPNKLDCANTEIPPVVYGLDWKPYIGTGNQMDFPELPIPPEDTTPPTPAPTFGLEQLEDDNDPLSLPGAEDPALALDSAQVWSVDSDGNPIAVDWTTSDGTEEVNSDSPFYLSTEAGAVSTAALAAASTSDDIPAEYKENPVLAYFSVSMDETVITTAPPVTPAPVTP